MTAGSGSLKLGPPTERPLHANRGPLLGSLDVHLVHEVAHQGETSPAINAAPRAPAALVVDGHEYASAFAPGLDLDRSRLQGPVGMLRGVRASLMAGGHDLPPIARVDLLIAEPGFHGAADGRQGRRLGRRGQLEWLVCHPVKRISAQSRRRPYRARRSASAFRWSSPGPSASSRLLCIRRRKMRTGRPSQDSSEETTVPSPRGSSRWT